MLILLVLVAGMVSMGVEMSASRLLAPFFGTSLYIWGILIGLILAYLTIGYWLGGFLADRRPRRRPLFTLNAIAGAAIALVALISTPLLHAALASTERLPYGLFLGSVAACLALFAIPVVLLGCVNPYAIRLSVGQVAEAGNTAGSIFALTTVGSLIGTFGAVFVLIPDFGTRATLYICAAALLGASLLGLTLANDGQAREETVEASH